MNKLIALFAMIVAGFAVTVNVEAAGKRKAGKAKTTKVAAKDAKDDKAEDEEEAEEVADAEEVEAAEGLMMPSGVFVPKSYFMNAKAKELEEKAAKKDASDKDKKAAEEAKAAVVAQQEKEAARQAKVDAKEAQDLDASAKKLEAKAAKKNATDADKTTAKEAREKADAAAAKITTKSQEEGFFTKAKNAVVNNPKIVIGVTAGVVITTAVVVDLCRGNKSYIRRLFSKNSTSKLVADKVAAKQAAQA